MKLAILLCTYNGGRYLRPQLDSFAAQTGVDWCVYVSDDGSSDETLSILSEYREKWGEKLTVFKGPQKGFVANYLSLMMRSEITADYYALSDQDDVWYVKKSQTAIEAIMGETRPALYCSRTLEVDAELNPLALSPHFKRPPSFQNALVQSLAGANTMVFNQAMLTLIRQTCQNITHVSHDWLLYQLVTGAGGKLHYDLEPSLHYRQHETNYIGSNRSWGAKLYRLKFVLKGRFKGWNEMNLTALEAASPAFTPHNQVIVAHYKAARLGGLINRLKNYWQSGVYRQTIAGTISLIIAVLLNKL